MVENSRSRKSFLDVAICGLYQFMLLAGLSIVSYAAYQIMGGTIQAIFMIFPGLLSLGGGLVLRKISLVNRFA